jgi:YidC/Oxa1 family membrane protein insertase
MSIFDLFLVQPIFNVLVLMYSIVPWHDFGVALILFTIIVRLLLWPLVKKQLHQTKVMRQIQPELAKIKQKAKGNRVLESQMMMELYKERGVNPFGAIGTLLLQLPIFIALYGVVQLITQNAANISKYTYDFLEGLPGIQDAIAGNLNHSLFGIIDLTKHATDANGVIYWPLLIMAVVAAVVQFFQSKMLLPQPKDKRKLRDMLKDQSSGKQVDQAEMSAAMTGKMIWLFPIITFVISTYLEGALVLYLLATNAVAIVQQHMVLNKDETELVGVSEKTKTKVKKAVEAEVVEEKPAPAAKKKGSSKKKGR